MRGFTVIHTEWSRGWGGQEMRTIQEASALKERGLRSLVVSRPECRILARARDASLPTIAVPMRGAFDPWAVAALCRLIRHERAAIVNTHSSIDSWIGAFAAKLTGTLLVRTRHVSIPIRTNPLNFVHRLPDAMITTGESVRERILADGFLPADRIVSIPTGVDIDHYSPAPDDGELRRSLGIPPEAPIVTTVAVLREKKRHDVLLEALARMRGGTELFCLLAGEGSARAAIEQRGRDLGLADRVFLLGHVEDVRPVLRSASVVVSTSSGMEGVPQALVQALAMRRPVVATDDGSVAELVRHEETGLLVPPDQPQAVAAAIERLLGDPGFAKDCAERGRQLVVQRYSQDAMTDRVLALYEELLQ